MKARLRVAIVTVSDRVAAGLRPDLGGDEVARCVQASDWTVTHRGLVPDERDAIMAAIEDLCVDADVVVTSGGTGLGPRDVTPEATAAVLDRHAPGIAEALRARSLAATPFGMLSRGLAGLVGTTLVINLPGNPKAVAESWELLGLILPHAVETARGPVSDESHLSMRDHPTS